MKGKRRKHSAEFKARVGLEALKEIKTVSEIAREYEIHPVQVSQWKNDLRERLPAAFAKGKSFDAEKAAQQEERLHKKIGQLTMDVEWLKKNAGS